MKPPCLPVLAFLALASSLPAATVFNGSGTSGFGGPVGGSSMEWADDGTNITVNFTKGAGDFNDAFVIYLDTGAAGRNTIGTDVNDRQDYLRSAISYMEASTGKTLALPAGFEASHAIAINTGYTGLWAIPASGSIANDGLAFGTALNNTLTGAGQASFTFTIPVASLGLTPNSGATIDFVATYLNPFGENNGLGYASNEGYGGGFPATNVGQNDLTITSALSYTIVPEPGAAALGLLGALALLRRRR